MEVFGYKDIALFFLITFVCIIRDNGWWDFAVLVTTNWWWLFFSLPYKYLSQRYYNPFPYQTPVSQRATNKEIIVMEMLRRYFNSSGDSATYTRLFFLNEVFQQLNQIRRLRYLRDGLGDVLSYTVSSNGILGLWLYSETRISTVRHDIIIFYVPGGLRGYGGGSAEMYLEYLSILTLNLLEQGFGNPLVFIPQVPENQVLYSQIIPFLLKCYHYVQEQRAVHSTQVVIAGDSTGATLALALLLQISAPSPLISEVIGNAAELRRPEGVLLISPICDIECTAAKNGCDYISVPVLAKWKDDYIPNSLFTSKEQRLAEENYFNPGMNRNVHLWKRACPKYGMIFSYGTEELVVSETKELASFLTTKCHVKLRQDKQTAQVHNWALLNFFTEDRVDHREVSLQTYSGALSRMLLWNSTNYVNLRTKEPTNVITLDEEYV